MANISTDEWDPKKDYLCYILLDQYIYTSSDKKYNKYFHNQKFVDSDGEVYKITDKKLPRSIIRSIFRFTPNVYKVELILTKTGEKMSVDEVRNFILKQIKKLEDNKWIDQIRKAKSIQEILGDSEG